MRDDPKHAAVPERATKTLLRGMGKEIELGMKVIPIYCVKYDPPLVPVFEYNYPKLFGKVGKFFGD